MEVPLAVSPPAVQAHCLTKFNECRVANFLLGKVNTGYPKKLLKAAKWHHHPIYNMHLIAMGAVAEEKYNLREDFKKSVLYYLKKLLLIIFNILQQVIIILYNIV